MLLASRLESFDRAPGCADWQLRVRRSESRLRVVVRQMPLFLQLNRGRGECLDIRAKPAARKIWSIFRGWGLLLGLDAQLFQGPVINASVDECVPARSMLRYANEFVRCGGQAEMEHAIVRRGNRPSQIDLTRRTCRGWGDQSLCLLKQVVRIQCRQPTPALPLSRNR